jgi:hypothetical protein
MRIILSKSTHNVGIYGGNILPARFWNWAVCEEEEFTDAYKQHGWHRSDCEKYLTREQLTYLKGE